jgi:hypothetical protein
MQNSRTFLVACAAAYCLALLPLCAADADADLKLREALEKKLNELQTQPPAPIPQPKETIALPTAKAPAAVPAAQPAAGTRAASRASRLWTRIAHCQSARGAAPEDG